MRVFVSQIHSFKAAESAVICVSVSGIIYFAVVVFLRCFSLSIEFIYVYSRCVRCSLCTGTYTQTVFSHSVLSHSLV